jgi:dolichyl-phosphate-mannose--protein O-mannosyl transferase
VIDWWLVARNAIWIAGAAIVLASWSYHRWLAATGTAPRAEVFQRPAWITASGIGAALFCIGFATSGRWWEVVAWAALAVFAVIRAWRGIQSLRWNRQP